MIASRVAVVLLASLALVCIACGSGAAKAPSSSRTAAPTTGGAGSLIMTRPDGIVEYNINTRETRPLIPADKPNTFFLDPDISPDGTQLVFVKQAPPVIEGSRYDAGADLWIANRDGTGARLLFQHEVDNQLVRFAQWQDDAHVLAVIQEITNKDGRTNVVYALNQIDVASGARTRLRDGVLGFAVSPEGDRLAYAALAPQTGETLEGANVDGSGEKTLVPVSENLTPFQSPRYSPDGKRIAFASADQTGAGRDQRYVTIAPARLATRLLDGLPEDIWLIDADGSPPQRIADIKEDLPSLTWSGDGKHIYVLGSLALYDVNVENGNTTQIGDGAYHGQLIWAP